MYNVIKRFAESEATNGLMLIDMPTGSGKTYSAIKYIFDSCLQAENEKRKYIFVTTLKKNLPVDDLRQRFEEAGKTDLFSEKVLFIDSNMDSVIDGWTDDVRRNIPYEIKKTDEYTRFTSDLEFVKKQRDKKDAALRDYLPSIESNLREKSEPAFRRVVSEFLNKKYSTVEKKLYAIKTEKEWQWLGKLYPAVFTRDRQVLLMSMDKFLSRNTTIVEPSYMFYNSDVIKDAIIFIDEFDATKETILKKIIDNGLHDKINYIELFKDIYASLHMDSFPAVLTTPSEERKTSKYSNQSLEGIVEGIKEKADYIFNTYSLQFKHRTSGEVEDLYQNYLFQDHQFHSILNANNSYITMTSDDKQRINSIGFAKTRPANEKNNIQVMLGQLRGFIKYFQGAVNILAINYMQCKKERRKEGEDAFTMEAAIRSVLSLFRLSPDSIDYLTSQIMISAHKIKGDIEPSDFDLSFYENGFRYYAFENDTAHDMQSQIMMYSFQNTPEKTLLRFCEKAKVIGISATATVPSVIGNFDIAYLKDKMQKVFVPLTDDERHRLSAEFEESQQGYNNVSINVDLLGESGKYTDSSWRMVFDDEELAKKIADDVRMLFSENEDKNNFNKERYLRVALAYKQFIIHDDIFSFLCVLTKHPKKGDKTLDRDLIEKIFGFIAGEHKVVFSAQKSVVYLDGAEYDDKKDYLIKRLSQGEKIFVISVYQTIGAGQNLQYPVPKALRDSLVTINDRVLREEKDFDAIYLDKPSNLIVNLVDNLEEPDFVKYLFQMEFLQETSELSADSAMKNIKKAFKTFMFAQRNAEEWANVYNRQSVVLMSTRYVIQAIGRICRTNIKSKNIYIFADDRIIENIDISVVDNRFFNPEFMRLIEAIKQRGTKTPEMASLEDAASLKAVRVNKDINGMLNNDWTEPKIERWKKLRELVLTHPTASQEEADGDFIIKNYYAQLPSKGNTLFYYQDADFNNISVAFYRDADHDRMVSEQGSKLPELLRIPGVKDLFIQNGWACSFQENDYLMTPALWNNIYKGALGEVVGKHIFSSVLSIDLEDIEDVDAFELFDYKVPGYAVYVDFKNWHEGETADRNQMLEKIARKGKKCGCRCAIIANIIAGDRWDTSDVEMEGVRIISIPALVKECNGSLSWNKEAWDVIRECVDGDKYKDK